MSRKHNEVTAPVANAAPYTVRQAIDALKHATEVYVSLSESVQNRKLAGKEMRAHTAGLMALGFLEGHRTNDRLKAYSLKVRTEVWGDLMRKKEAKEKLSAREDSILRAAASRTSEAKRILLKFGDDCAVDLRTSHGEKAGEWIKLLNKNKAPTVDAVFKLFRKLSRTNQEVCRSYIDTYMTGGEPEVKADEAFLNTAF